MTPGLVLLTTSDTVIFPGQGGFSADPQPLEALSDRWIEAKSSPRFFALLQAFDARTGVPLVLNTSFNLNGEPVVCAPEDAIRSFYTCPRRDLGNVRITK